MYAAPACEVWGLFSCLQDGEKRFSLGDCDQLTCLSIAFLLHKHGCSHRHFLSFGLALPHDDWGRHGHGLFAFISRIPKDTDVLCQRPESITFLSPNAARWAFRDDEGLVPARNLSDALATQKRHVATQDGCTINCMGNARRLPADVVHRGSVYHGVLGSFLRDCKL